MNKKVLLASIVMAGLLSGCATDDMQDSKIAALEAKVAELYGMDDADLAETKMMATNAQAEAERANKRIDNIATSYKK